MITTRSIDRSGFSLVELLVAIAGFTVIMLVLSQALSTTLGAWRKASDRDVQFQESKAAFDSVRARLATAELSPYWGFEYPAGPGGKSQSPVGYDLLSDLHFVSGHANSAVGSCPPLLPNLESPTHAIFFHGSFGHSEEPTNKGFDTLMNAWGYYIEYGDDSGNFASFLTTEGGLQPRSRFRLMELQIPSEELATFRNDDPIPDELDLDTADTALTLFDWFRRATEDDPATPDDDSRAVPIAENIIALVILPRPAEDGTGIPVDPSTLAPDYYYDSRANQHTTSPVTTALEESTEHRLPPMVQVTMVAIAESSAQLYEAINSSATPPDFGLDLLFQDATKYDADLETLSDTLVAENINFRIYTNTIRLRNARWSQN